MVTTSVTAAWQQSGQCTCIDKVLTARAGFFLLSWLMLSCYVDDRSGLAGRAQNLAYRLNLMQAHPDRRIWQHYGGAL
jgi:hypothetical protein